MPFIFCVGAQKQNNNNNKNSSWDELRASPESKCRLNVTPATRSAIEPIVTTLVARSMAKVIDRQANERQEHANAREQQQAQQQQQQLDSTNCHNRRSKSESQGCPENVSPLVIAHPGPTFVRAKRIGSIQHRQPPRTVFGKLINFTTMMMMMVVAASASRKRNVNAPRH